MESQTIFDKIIRKEIPSEVVYEDESVLAFRDINPQAPTHILIIPKNKDGLSGISKAEDKHAEILGKLMVCVSKIAAQQKLTNGFRVIINDGEQGGQQVMHLHLHLIGGKQLGWPNP